MSRRLKGQPVAPNPIDQPQEAPDTSGMRGLEGRDVKELRAVKGINLKRKGDIPQKKSPNQLKREAEERFNQLAEKAVESRESRNKEMFEAAQAMVDMIKDKTLKKNISHSMEENQNAVRKKLVDLAFQTNNDELEQYDGMGSVALISLMLKMFLVQRDRMNDQEFLIQKLKERFVEMRQEIIELKKSSEHSDEVEKAQDDE